MPYLVGYTADRGGREALALGRMLALSAGDSLIVCTVVPETWGYPSPARVDAEYAAFLDRHARRALARARATLGGDVQADMVARSASSVVAGLVAVAEDTRAELIVLGSARHGPIGRFTVGSVTEGLQQLAPVPVALAPKGYRPTADTRVPRITCAWAPVPGSDALLAAATALCREHRAPLRLATLVVRDRQMYPSGVGYDIENMVANEWRASAQEAQREALATPAGRPRRHGRHRRRPRLAQGARCPGLAAGRADAGGLQPSRRDRQDIARRRFEPDHPQCAGAGHRAAARRRAGRGHLTPRKPAIREGCPP